MKTSLKNILKCPKCKNLYGLIPEKWDIGEDVLSGQVFICSGCLNYGQLQDDYTIKLISEDMDIYDEDDVEEFENFSSFDDLE